MSALDFPLMNGVAPSWADLQVSVTPNGGIGALVGALTGSLLQITDFYSIDSGWEVEVGEQRSGGRVINRTTGSIKHTASASMYASGYQKLIDALAAVAPKERGQARISLVSFTLAVQWQPPGAINILERRIKGCRLTGAAFSSSEGTDVQRVDLTLNPLQVADVRNGLEIVGI